MRTALVIIQAATFVGLGALLCGAGELRLGVAQFLLAGVTFVVYA